MPKLLIYLIFILSGVCALVYEVLWVRTLGLVLGVTVYATSIVLGSYMSGLAAGSFFIGRVVDRKAKNPLLWYGVLEVLIAASSLCATLIFIALSKPQGLALPQSANYFVAVVLIFIPTFFMGGTLPVISRFLISDPAQSGRFSGLLYGLNTLGGMIGCLLAGFVLVRLLGVQNSALSTIGINLLIGVIAILIARSGFGSEHPPAPAAAGIRQESSGGKFLPVLLVLYAISGFCSLGYEVLWTRALVFNLGNNTYAFSVMLATFLLGLGLGSAMASRFVNRVKNIVALLGLLQILIGITVFCGTDLIYRMDVIVNWIWLRTGQSWLAANMARFCGAMLLMALPTMLIGALMPVVNRIYGHGGVGKSIGTVYSANTLGTILGSVCAGFVLIPLLGITKSILLLATLNVTLGLVCFFYQSRKAYLLAGCAVLCLLFPAAQYFASRKPFPLYSPGLSREGSHELLYYKEGATASVGVIKMGDGTRMLSVNGVYTAYTNIGDLQVHYLLAYLPYFLCPQPQDALVIGLGLGVTSASLQSAGMKVDCVELAKEEIGSAPFLSAYNDSILAKPGFSLIIGDGRHHLRKAARKYDVITSNAVHVRMSPYLYTKEFYELCRARLNPHGVVCQWLPSNNLPGKEFKQLIRAFQMVFVHTSIWYVNPGHYLLIGTMDPLSVNYRRFAERCLQEAVQKKLATVHLDNPMVVLSMLELDERGSAAYTGELPPHSDDKPCAEFVRVIETRKASNINVFPPALSADLKSVVADKNDSLALRLDSVTASAAASRAGEIAGWLDNYEEALDAYGKAIALFAGSLCIATVPLVWFFHGGSTERWGAAAVLTGTAAGIYRLYLTATYRAAQSFRVLSTLNLVEAVAV
ncbi:MAG: fused MFS/spermidine synthase, partial [Chitinispirillaceae bacterium]|nr:fused MFS/spermidine synthase [Chitinispirillaceae bacterium]